MQTKVVVCFRQMLHLKCSVMLNYDCGQKVDKFDTFLKLISDRVDFNISGVMYGSCPRNFC